MRGRNCSKVSLRQTQGDRNIDVMVSLPNHDLNKNNAIEIATETRNTRNKLSVIVETQRIASLL
jgi:hypothetical protein